MKLRNDRSLILILIAILILAALGLAFFHHHDEAEEGHHKCVVCHFVKSIVLAFFAFLILVFSRTISQHFDTLKEVFSSRFFPKSLLARAPPIL